MRRFILTFTELFYSQSATANVIFLIDSISSKPPFPEVDKVVQNRMV